MARILGSVAILLAVSRSLCDGSLEGFRNLPKRWSFVRVSR
jgi:hypothetical protein